MDTQRNILFIALGLILFMIWQAWEAEQRQAQPVTVTKAPTDTPSVPKVETKPGDQVTAAPVTPGAPQATPESVSTPPIGQRIRIETDLIEAWIDAAGGDLRELRLKKHPKSIDKPEVGFALLTEDANNYFISQSGLLGSERSLPNHKSLYRIRQDSYRLAEGEDKIEVPLGWTGPDGVQYTKTFVFYRNRYLIDVRYEVTNRSGKPWRGFLYSQLRGYLPEEGRSAMALPTYKGPVYYTPEEKFQKYEAEDIREKELKLQVRGGWAGMMQHYFVGAALPEKNMLTEIYTQQLGQGHYVIGYKTLEPVSIAPGSNAVINDHLYIGPKESRRLARLQEGMDLTVDFGALTFLSAPLFWLLDKIHGFVGNWGVAIILLTMLIKLVFFPLSAASYRSMAHMRRVQPEMTSIRERFKGDKQRMNQAMMELYKKEKINPLGGCLPILIQIPVFIALYWVLLESVEMRQAPFMLWIKDLAAPDPYFVLPVIMGVSMYVQHWLNPSPMDPMQKKIMQFLPAMFTIFFLFFPSGLVLYWVVNNILSIAQQWQITRMIEGGKKA